MGRIANFITVALFAFSFFSYFYIAEFSMGICESEIVNEKKTADARLLIASQQSAYKDQLSDQIIEGLEEENIYIELIDLTNLNPNYSAEFDAIIIIHTWEMNKPPSEVEKILNSLDSNKVFTITTSGSGYETIAGVDGISSASRIVDVESDASKAITWFNTLTTNS